MCRLSQEKGIYKAMEGEGSTLERLERGWRGDGFVRWWLYLVLPLSPAPFAAHAGCPAETSGRLSLPLGLVWTGKGLGN